MADWFPKLNVLIAAVLVTIGFTMAWNPIRVSLVVAAGLVFTALLLWLGTTPRHTWAWACLFLGLESLSWPMIQMIKLRVTASFEQATDEQMQSLVADLIFGIVFATFWLTFAYGIFRAIRRSESETTQP